METLLSVVQQSSVSSLACCIHDALLHTRHISPICKHAFYVYFFDSHRIIIIQAILYVLPPSLLTTLNGLYIICRKELHVRDDYTSQPNNYCSVTKTFVM